MTQSSLHGSSKWVHNYYAYSMNDRFNAIASAVSSIQCFMDLRLVCVV